MEDRFDVRFQIHSGTTVCATRSATVGTPSTRTPLPPAFGYFHRFHRRREIAPRRQPIPDPIQILFPILFELLDRLPHPHPAAPLFALTL